MTGWDGGFFGLPLTCECRIYGETKGRKSCSNFKKRITKSDLLNKIQSLEKENEQLKEKLQSVTMLKDDYEELIESFEKKYGKNIEDVIDDE